MLLLSCTISMINHLQKCNPYPDHSPRMPLERTISLAECQLDVVGRLLHDPPPLVLLFLSRITVAPVDILLACNRRISSCLWILTSSNFGYMCKYCQEGYIHVILTGQLNVATKAPLAAPPNVDLVITDRRLSSRA